MTTDYVSFSIFGNKKKVFEENTWMQVCNIFIAVEYSTSV